MRGSERQPLPDARPAHELSPAEHLEVTVRVRPKTDPASLLATNPFADQLPAGRTYLTREQLGANPHDLTQVHVFAHAYGLAVVHTDAARRSVVLAGTAAAMGAVFGTQL